MIRDAKKKEEFERGYLLEFAEERGAKQKLEENIKTMFRKGATPEMISNLLDLNIDYVNEVLTK